MDSLRTHTLSALFPPPTFITMPAAGIDISDTSIKYVEAKHTRHGFIPQVLEAITIPKGIVVNGVVENGKELTNALKQIKGNSDRHFANVSLPEELVYLYTLEVPSAHTRKEILQIIEFSLSEHAPIPVENSVFNYDVIRQRGDITEISVTVFPKNIVDGYMQAFKESGFAVKVFELEASSVVRSVVPSTASGVSMVVDFGRTRTGITIAFKQVPLFSTTVKIGGDVFTEAIMKYKKVSLEEVDTIKREQGIADCTDAELCAVLTQTAQLLVKEVQRHYRYWNTRRDATGNTTAPIERVYLCGGAVALKGLPEHIADMLQVPVEIGNIWGNMFSLEEYIPKVSQVESQRYATAVGLLLESDV